MTVSSSRASVIARRCTGLVRASGHSMNAVGDRVRATRTAARGVTIRAIEGVVRHLPTDPAKNTASVAVQALLDAVDPGHGFELTIEKGIPLGSGLGGSAASAVAAVVAANALLARPFDKLSLLKFAMRNPTAGTYSDTSSKVGPKLTAAFRDTIVDIVTGRQKMDAYDAALKRWKSGGGDKMRDEFAAVLPSSVPVTGS